MKINWKDFILMFVIWFLLFNIFGFVYSTINSFFPASNLLILFLVFFFPLAYYFYKNRSKIVVSLAISFAYGFVLSPLMFLLSLLGPDPCMVVRASGNLCTGFDLSILILELLIEGILLGIGTAVLGVIISLIFSKLFPAEAQKKTKSK